MAALNTSISHSLSEAEALKRIKKLLRDTKKQYGDLVTDLKEKWEGNKGTFSFKAKGYVLTGTISVTSRKVEIKGELPWALSFIKGKIERMISERAHELLQ